MHEHRIVQKDCQYNILTMSYTCCHSMCVVLNLLLYTSKCLCSILATLIKEMFSCAVDEAANGEIKPFFWQLNSLL